MNERHEGAGGCAWCGLPKARRGIVIGVAASLLFHAGLLGVVYSAGGADKSETVKPSRTIYVGTFVIKSRHSAKEI